MPSHRAELGQPGIADSLAKRVNAPTIARSIAKPFVTAILGPRRVGKSTTVTQFRLAHPDYLWVVFNMDVLSQRKQIADGGLRSAIERKALQKIGDGDKCWVIVDEAQKCPELFDQIKVIYDEFKGQDVIKFILTGSASLDLHQLSAESLAGRIELLHMREFTIQETAMLHHHVDLPDCSLFDVLINEPEKVEEVIDRLSPYQDVLEKALNEQLIFGGLPEVMAMTSVDDRLQYLDQYIQSYLEKDVRQIADISDLDLFQKCLLVLAEQTGSLRDDTQILASLGCARNTLKKYRGYLISSMVYHEVYPLMNHALKRIIKSPKGYVGNNGILSILTGLDDLSILQRSGKIGHRMENWFLKELQVWGDRQSKRHPIYYWRTQNGMEVDFILACKLMRVPFEVTSSSQCDSKKIKNISVFMKASKNTSYGILVYRGPYCYNKSLNIHCIPAWAIC